VREGFQIIGTNVRVGRGEIDFIAHRDGVFVVCEVKTRFSSDFGDPAEALTEKKQRTVRTAALTWARANGVELWRLRFDLACITGRNLSVYPNAF